MFLDQTERKKKDHRISFPSTYQNKHKLENNKKLTIHQELLNKRKELQPYKINLESSH